MRPAIPMYAIATLMLGLSVCAVAESQAPEPSLSGAAITPFITQKSEAARILFEQRCGLCHGLTGRGGRGPSLRRSVLDHASSIPEIASVIQNGIPPAMPQHWFFSDRDLDSLATYVYSLGRAPDNTALPGDPARGKAVFENNGCPGCHILGGRGNGYGPDLTYIGGAHSPDQLRKIVTEPQSYIIPGFQLVEVVDASGATLQGVRRNEDTLTIQIQDPSGTFHSFEKAQLQSFRRLRGQTPMPSFAGMLSNEQLDDLVSYLALQRRTR